MTNTKLTKTTKDLTGHLVEVFVFVAFVIFVFKGTAP